MTQEPSTDPMQGVRTWLEGFHSLTPRERESIVAVMQDREQGLRANTPSAEVSPEADYGPLIASLNGDLLEDFDGAPFPDVVQAAWAVRRYEQPASAVSDVGALHSAFEQVGLLQDAVTRAEAAEARVVALREALERIHEGHTARAALYDEAEPPCICGPALANSDSIAKEWGDLREPLRLLDVIDGIVDETHPEGDGCPLCSALDDLRDALLSAQEPGK